MNRINVFLSFLLLFLILLFSLLPLPSPKEAKSYHIDKIGHLLFYSLWGYFAYPVLGLFSVGYGTIFGMITEFLQRFIPNRESSLGDFAFNLIGIGLGILIRRRRQ